VEQLRDPASRSVLGDWYEARGIAARTDIEAISRIAAIIARKHELGSKDRPELRSDPDRRRAVRVENRQLTDELDGIQHRLRDEFMAVRGWRTARSRFGFDELATGRRPEHGPFRRQLIQPDFRLINHPERFREPQRPFRPVAILTHSSNTNRHPFNELAAATGLTVEFLPWSWYYPGSCIAALFTRGPGWKQAPSREERRRQNMRTLREGLARNRAERESRLSETTEPKPRS
jgi:hypothetical protein